MRSRTFRGFPEFSLPIDQTLRWLTANALPPRLVVGSHRNVGEDGIAIQRLHDVWIGLPASTRRDAKESRFRIDGVQVAVVANVHPGDIVANGPDSVALISQRGNHHGEIGFPARAGKSGYHVGDFAPRRFQTEDEHVLGHPALVARHVTGDAQRETFLSQQRIAAIAGAHAPDEPLLWKVHDVATQGVEIAERV
jgi:hypothetical protein